MQQTNHSSKCLNMNLEEIVNDLEEHVSIPSWVTVCTMLDWTRNSVRPCTVNCTWPDVPLQSCLSTYQLAYTYFIQVCAAKKTLADFYIDTRLILPASIKILVLIILREDTGQHTEIRRVVISLIVIDHVALVQSLLDMVVCAFRVEICCPWEVDQSKVCVTEFLMNLQTDISPL